MGTIFKNSSYTLCVFLFIYPLQRMNYILSFFFLQQNETAADVARRKQCKDIVEIITSQPKLLKEKKKQKDIDNKENKKADKLVVKLPEDSEKKEKKGFHWFNKLKKSKSKDKQQQHQPHTQQREVSGSSIEVREEDLADYYKPSNKGGSDISSRSSEFTSNATPQEHMMRVSNNIFI